MPGELGNCIAGRVANVFNLRGPNFTVDAACASAMAAMDARDRGPDRAPSSTSAITGGIDRNMGASTYVKFCKIGALSATGTRPFADGADGFVMGEGAGAVRAQAPRRRRARRRPHLRGRARRRRIERRQGQGHHRAQPGRASGSPSSAPGAAPACRPRSAAGRGARNVDAVGDVVEVASLARSSPARLAPGSIALGSVKSNIGHLKAAAGAAGLLKAALALHHKVLPPSIDFERPNPNIDWSRSPFAVNTELRDWEVPPAAIRVAGVSAFGFGGTNFHTVLEEYVPGRLTTATGARSIAVPGADRARGAARSRRAGRGPARQAAAARRARARRRRRRRRSATSCAPRWPGAPGPRTSTGAADRRRTLARPERVAIDYGDGDELAAKASVGAEALRGRQPRRVAGAARAAASSAAAAARARSRSSSPARARSTSTCSPSCASASRSSPTPSRGRRDHDAAAGPAADRHHLRRRGRRRGGGARRAGAAPTEITQPAVLATDIALDPAARRLRHRARHGDGAQPRRVRRARRRGRLSFDAALEAVSARGQRDGRPRRRRHRARWPPSWRRSTRSSEIVAAIDGYVVIANVNSHAARS